MDALDTYAASAGDSPCRPRTPSPRRPHVSSARRLTAAGLSVLLAVAACLPASGCSSDDTSVNPTEIVEQDDTTPEPREAETTLLDEFAFDEYADKTVEEVTYDEFDFTGDGNDDVLVAKVGRHKVCLYMEDELVGKVSHPDAYSSYTITYLCTETGRTALFVTATGDNADGAYRLLCWGDDGFVVFASAADVPEKYCAGHRYISDVTAVGRRIEVTYAPMTYTAGTLDMTFTFHWRRGTFKLASAKTDVIETSAGGTDTWLAVVRDVSLLDDTIVFKGDRVQLIGAYLFGGELTFKLRTESGHEAWIEAWTEDDDPSLTTMFRKTSLAG